MVYPVPPLTGSGWETRSIQSTVSRFIHSSGRFTGPPKRCSQTSTSSCTTFRMWDCAFTRTSTRWPTRWRSVPEGVSKLLCSTGRTRFPAKSRDLLSRRASRHSWEVTASRLDTASLSGNWRGITTPPSTWERIWKLFRWKLRQEYVLR